jgi:hypothetical protein
MSAPWPCQECQGCYLLSVMRIIYVHDVCSWWEPDERQGPKLSLKFYQIGNELTIQPLN